MAPPGSLFGYILCSAGLLFGLASDMPFVNRTLLEHMIGIAAGFDAIVPKLGVGSYFEPFRAIYRQTCLELSGMLLMLVNDG